MTGSRETRLFALGRRFPLSLIVFGIVLYATGPTLVQASDVSGPVFSFWRLWIGVALFLPLTVAHVALTGRRPSRAGWGWAARAGVAFGLHQLFFMIAVKATSVVDVALMGALAPVVVGIIAVPLFGERPGPAFRLWSAVAIAGAALVVLGGSAGPEGDPWGMVLATLNVVCFAWFFVWSKQGRASIDVVPFLLGVMVVAALTVSGYVALAGEPVGAVDGRSLGLAAAVALGPGALGHFVMTWPLRWVPANLPPVMRLGQPALAGIIAWVALGEAIDGIHVVAGAVTLVGVAGAVRSPAGRRLAAEAERSGRIGHPPDPPAP